MRVLLLFCCLLLNLNGNCQLLPEENFFDGYYFDNDKHSPTYKENLISVKRNDIKSIIIWDCEDSNGTNMRKYCQMNYDRKHRILSELYYEKNKVIPYEKYKYVSNKKIIKKFNADNLYWIKYEMSLNENGQIGSIKVNGGKCYDIVIKYEYSDSILLKKEIYDNSCDLYLEGEGTTLFKYDSSKRITKIENIVSKNIESFSYNPEGYLFEYIQNKGNPEWENKMIRYSFSNGKLVLKISESFNSGRKEDTKILETSFIYNTRDLLEKEIVKNIKNDETSIRLYKYDDKGMLIQTVWLYPDNRMKNIYKMYTYEFH